jgi:hypothetical protein
MKKTQPTPCLFLFASFNDSAVGCNTFLRKVIQLYKTTCLHTPEDKEKGKAILVTGLGGP